MPRQACSSCGSKRWYKDRDSGQIVCESGHVLSVRSTRTLRRQTYVQESHEVEEFGRAGTGHARKPARKQRKSGKDKAKIKKVQRASFLLDCAHG